MKLKQQEDKMLKLSNPMMRFEGWEPSGLFKRTPDTRSVEELRASIEAWARKVPDVKLILPELKNMNPKHLGLVADTIELSQKPATFYKDVDMINPEEGKSFWSPLEMLMVTFPIVSKQKPHAMDFSQEVIDQTGKLMSKFFLKSAADKNILLEKGADEKYRAAIPLVEDLAKEAISVPLDKSAYSRQKAFVDKVLSVINKDTDLEKIDYLKEIYKILAGRILPKFNIYNLLTSKASLSTIKENAKSLDLAIGMAYSHGKILDVNEFLIKDANDVRIPFYNSENAPLQRLSREDLIKSMRSGI